MVVNGSHGPEGWASPACDVVMPCCNGAEFLDEQIRSILNQSHPPRLLLLSDDASDDNTTELLRGWERRALQSLDADPATTRIRILLASQRLGITANVDRALSHLRRLGAAPYVLLADQDDVWDADKIEVSLAAMAELEQRRGTDAPLLVHTDLRLIDRQGRPLAPSFHRRQGLDPRRDSLHDLVLQNVVTGCTMMMNRALLTAALPIPAAAVLHDGWIALVAAGLGEIGYVPRATVSYRQHGANLVGADAFRPRRIRAWLRSLGDGTAAERHLDPAIRQAIAFTERFGPIRDTIADTLPSELLERLRTGTTGQRLKAARRLRLHKQGWRRSLGWWISLLWPRRPRKEGPGPEFRPYHIRTPHVVPHDRPLVLHAIANVQTGGSTRLVVDLVEGLSHLYEHRVITSYLPNPPEYVGLVAEELPHNTSPKRVEASIRRQRPRMLHVHYWGSHDFPWYKKIFDAAERLGIPVIQNINTPIRPYPSQAIARNVYVSDYVRRRFAPWDEGAWIIHPGSDFELFSAANQVQSQAQQQENARSAHNPVSTKPPGGTVGMVYRLEPDKLSLKSIDVFLAIARRRRTSRCLIVGGGSLLEHYRRRVAEEGLGSSFEFTNYVAYDRLPAYYSQFDIFIAPVWSESFGQVTPFAMSMGLPVVGYNVGALPEILGDERFLAPPGDAEALAEKAIRLLDDPAEQNRIGELNRSRAQALFSVKAMLQSYEALYAEAMEVTGHSQVKAREHGGLRTR